MPPRLHFTVPSCLRIHRAHSLDSIRIVPPSTEDLGQNSPVPLPAPAPPLIDTSNVDHVGLISRDLNQLSVYLPSRENRPLVFALSPQLSYADRQEFSKSQLSVADSPTLRSADRVEMEIETRDLVWVCIESYLIDSNTKSEIWRAINNEGVIHVCTIISVGGKIRKGEGNRGRFT